MMDLKGRGTANEIVALTASTVDHKQRWIKLSIYCAVVHETLGTELTEFRVLVLSLALRHLDLLRSVAMLKPVH